MNSIDPIPLWPKANPINGILETRLSSWDEFRKITFEELLDKPYYIFRGQRRNNWLLESSLARILKMGMTAINRKIHLENFKYSIRGRRGLNPPSINEEEWWALGQHFGLATPLLDWTASPYVALFLRSRNMFPMMKPIQELFLP